MTSQEAISLQNLNIDPKWYIEDHCAGLVVKGGNFNNVEDRIAFIEKTPRYKNKDSVYVSGPKGPGGNLEDEPELYGFYPPSRQWIIDQLIKNNHRY